MNMRDEQKCESPVITPWHFLGIFVSSRVKIQDSDLRCWELQQKADLWSVITGGSLDYENELGNLKDSTVVICNLENIEGKTFERTLGNTMKIKHH